MVLYKICIIISIITKHMKHKKTLLSFMTLGQACTELQKKNIHHIKIKSVARESFKLATVRPN